MVEFEFLYWNQFTHEHFPFGSPHLGTLPLTTILPECDKTNYSSNKEQKTNLLKFASKILFQWALQVGWMERWHTAINLLLRVLTFLKWVNELGRCDAKPSKPFEDIIDDWTDFIGPNFKFTCQNIASFGYCIIIASSTTQCKNGSK